MSRHPLHSTSRRGAFAASPTTRLTPLLALAAFAAVLALPAEAASPRRAVTPVQLQLVERDSGRILPSAWHAGQRWVAGEPGQRYAVRLHNTSARRVLVVLSVDGINAISGESASPSQTGYVLAPGQSADIAGWRKSLEDIAGFHFTRIGDSYAARTGRPDNVGVIGLAVFYERITPPMPQPGPPISSMRRAAPPAPAAEAAAQDRAYSSAATAPAQSVGTGHGAREHAPVRYVDFERASRQPAFIATLRYDTRANLLARGVPIPSRQEPWHPREPRAFPAGFVPDPW